MSEGFRSHRTIHHHNSLYPFSWKENSNEAGQSFPWTAQAAKKRKERKDANRKHAYKKEEKKK